ncbi:uncharacterized protein LOC117327123 [Pecten maximus]|uniref:uncharacterized protein LOC117327123 n=1 Tax=Pecten maximus TaxID=6579 RepID=UPI0014582626|nr:uncharacterized protein LOC117327123 [Pecten maximus]
MAEQVREEDQKRIVQNRIRVEEVRETCPMINCLKFEIFMFAVSFVESDLTGNFGNIFLGSIYYYDISERRSFGSLDVYEIQTGGGMVILPGVFNDDDSDTANNNRVPTDFLSFPKRSDYIDIHGFGADFELVVHREYHNPSEDDNRNENDEECNSRETHNASYRRKTMHEIANDIHSRHDPCTPSMKNIEQRMRTFHGWRMTGEWTAEKVAQAGYFYTGYGDQAECYHCSFCVHEWDEAPIVMHVRWAPRCRFLRDTFSQDFIYDILFNRNN